jgi:SOS-response transcriptional repressor LexA
MPHFTIAPIRDGGADWNRARPVPRPALTQVQLKILAFIHWYQQMWAATPIYREIARACGLGSDSAVAYQVRRLVQLGVVRKPARLHRAVLLNLIPVPRPA